MSNVDICQSMGRHDAAKSSADAFAAATVRLPHLRHREAYQDDGEGGSYLVRNCVACGSTLMIRVTK